MIVINLQVVAHQTSVGGPNDNYYGLQAITDVYGHDLKTGQLSATIIWVHHTGDGGKSSLNTIQVGWHVSNTFILSFIHNFLIQNFQSWN